MNGDIMIIENQIRDRPAIEGRGFSIVYREEQVNHCPGCGKTNWYIGRMMAECGFCTTALPLTRS